MFIIKKLIFSHFSDRYNCILTFFLICLHKFGRYNFYKNPKAIAPTMNFNAPCAVRIQFVSRPPDSSTTLLEYPTLLTEPLRLRGS